MGGVYAIIRQMLLGRKPEHFACFFFKDFVYLFSERKEGREKERDKSINVWEKHQLVVSHTPTTGDLSCSPGMCPDRESNQRPFGLQASTQSTELHQSGLLAVFIYGLNVHFGEPAWLFLSADSFSLVFMVLKELGFRL